MDRCLNASKVWRQERGVKAMLPVKSYDEALAEALALFGNTREGYKLTDWSWGYREEAGNVEQRG